MFRALPFLIALALGGGAMAQTVALGRSEPYRGVALPPTSVALVDESTALELNPAGLTQLPGAQLFYVFDRSTRVGRSGHGVFLGMPLAFGLSGGVGVQWVARGAEHRRKTTLGLSYGGALLALGGNANFYGSTADESLAGLTTYDIGLISHPTRWLAIGAMGRNIDGPVRRGVAFGREYQLGIGLRPLDERFALALDYIAPPGAFNDGRIGYTAQVQLFRSLVLSAGASHGFGTGADPRVQLGFGWNFGLLGATYSPAIDMSEHIFAIRASADRYPTWGGKRVAVLDLRDLLTPKRGLLQSLLGLRQTDPYLALTIELDRATRDPTLAGVVLKLDDLPEVGLAKAQELRGAVLRLRQAGKKVIAVLLSVEDAEYLVASAADHIFAVPQAILLVNGFAASGTFLGDGMQRLGVHFDVARVGAYKNAPDALTRSDMSKEHRETIEAYLDADVRTFQQALAERPGLTRERIADVWKEALISPERAKALGLVHDVLDPKALDDRVGELVPGARVVHGFGEEDRRPVAWGPKQRIAIIPVIGDIVGGKSREDPLGMNELAGAETVITALERAAADPRVAAIVLRVDSPGGEGLASELMYRAVLAARKKKPVIASMGDVAASGGYYAAAGAEEILASETTITGSIGVFFLKPSVGRLAEKLGVNRVTIKRGEQSTLADPFTSWSLEEKKVAERWVQAFYADFVRQVADSRKLAFDEVDAVARGRVWAGVDAKGKKLVDRMGGLLEAIDTARKRAGIEHAAMVEVVVLGEPASLFASLAGEENTRTLIPKELVPLAKGLGIHRAHLFEPSLKAMMPFDLKVE